MGIARKWRNLIKLKNLSCDCNSYFIPPLTIKEHTKVFLENVSGMPCPSLFHNTYPILHLSMWHNNRSLQLLIENITPLANCKYGTLVL